MLESINLKNYKCFETLKVDNNEELKIAPLTLLCGINSSGKSSIIKSLLMLKQSFENSSSSNELTLNGKYVKCGRFEDLSSKHNEKPITISTTYKLKKPITFMKQKKYRNKKSSKYDITAFKNLNKIYNNEVPEPDYFSIKSTIIIEKNDNKKMIDNNILSEQWIDISVVKNNQKEVHSTIHLKKLKNQLSQYSISLDNIPDGDTGNIIEHVELLDATCYFENFNLINVYSIASNIKPRNTQISGLLANIYLIFKMNALQFKNINYLTPLRGYPKRNYILDCEIDDVGSSGEFTPYIMNKYNGHRIDGFLPPKNNKLSITKMEIDFNECVQSWMNYLGLGKYSLLNSAETMQLNIQDYNISNVGFGVSQVLPIIVSGLIKRKSELLLLEQPEIHLHPKAQMSMADFLISMAINGKGAIVETHSDHIINRVVRRMMEDSTVYKNVKIYFIDQNMDGVSSIQDVKIDVVDGAICDNQNFFFQFASETEKIIDVGYRNLQKQQGSEQNVQNIT